MQTSMSRTFVLTFAVWSWTCCFASCLGQASDPPIFTVQEYPRIDGSISPQPLGSLVACRLTHRDFGLASSGDYEEIEGGSRIVGLLRNIFPKIGPCKPGKQFSWQTWLPFKKIDSNEKLAEKIWHTNTHPSYVNLIERKVALVFAAREPSDAEINLSRQKGVEIKTFPIARDALVFIVNELNRVNNLSIEQIRDIFSGRLLDWADVGGYKATIYPYRRNRNLGVPSIARNPRVKTEETNTKFGPRYKIPHEPYGLSYSFYYFEKYMVTPYYFDKYMADTPCVKLVAVNNVVPSKETIRNATYPLITEVVVAYLSDLPEESPAARIRDWLLTAEGQKVVAESGYVPIKE
jgi:phosphate transport system substrate-binding protein